MIAREFGVVAGFAETLMPKRRSQLIDTIIDFHVWESRQWKSRQVAQIARSATCDEAHGATVGAELWSDLDTCNGCSQNDTERRDGSAIMKNLEEVFKRSGVPTHTFVQPQEYNSLLVSIRTRGRGTIVEGPSGIGKTTSVLNIIDSLPGAAKVTQLSGRKPNDFDIITALPDMGNLGIVLIDDFHRLPDGVKHRLADYIKLLADSEDPNSKIIIVGINKAGKSLLTYAADLTGRIDTITFESNPKEKIEELIAKGETALNANINIKAEIAEEAQGSFHIAQMLCHESCLEAGILAEKEGRQTTRSSLEVVREKVLVDLAQTFLEKAKLFATGPRLRREGRAPYFFLLRWLAIAKESTINIDDVLRNNPEHRGSVGQIVDKGFLSDHISNNPELQEVIHFDSQTKELSIEDPKLFYYLRNLLWSKFAERVGYRTLEFKSQYDYALSFAGADRDIAEALFQCLTSRELSVFYDRNEQHRILAENVEDYLAPIYKSEASFVVVLLGKEYPKRIWTKFESEQFKHRFGENTVIPIWFDDAPPGMFDESTKVGGITFSRGSDFDAEVMRICELLCAKISDYKSAEPIA
jgi:hypothetical protein